MTMLLVSVRSATEARIAFDGGADWIDVKEPARGPLGCADASTIIDVLRSVNDRAPVSAAIGELRDRPHSITGLTLAKCGLVGLKEHWRQRWLNWRHSLPRGCDGVLVAYAESPEVNAPDPIEIVQFALDARPAAFLIDTAIKDGRTLFDHWPVNRLADLVSPLRQVQIPFALAGSLRFGQLDELLSLDPGWIAVRGAVCVGGRNGLVSAKLVARWKAAISGNIRQPCSNGSHRLPLFADR